MRDQITHSHSTGPTWRSGSARQCFKARREAACELETMGHTLSSSSYGKNKCLSVRPSVSQLI